MPPQPGTLAIDIYAVIDDIDPGIDVGGSTGVGIGRY
jgi:hypothetical protein